MQIILKDNEKYFLNAHSKLRDALQKLNDLELKLVLIIDSKGKLIRTVTDGDIRRGLLEGLSLDDEIKILPGRKPFTIKDDSTFEETKKILTKNKIDNIVVVDDFYLPKKILNINECLPKILLSPPHLGNKEKIYINEAIEANWVAPAGPNTSEFEKMLAQITGKKYVVALNSGTSALHLSLKVLNLKSEHIVYVSDKTFIASVQPLLYEGLTPVFIDSEPHTWNMSPLALERRILKDFQNDLKPGAIVLTHLYGQSAEIDRILNISKKYNIPIIEDACESLGAEYKGKASGTHGLLGVYSFNGNKIITTSGGGAVVTNDKNLADKIKFLSTQGRDSYEHYQHSSVAYNYRMSNILAGIGRAQLELLPRRVSRRREIFEIYKNEFDNFPGITFQKEASPSRGSRWLTVMRFNPDFIDFNPFSIMRELRETGIETRPSWKPMHMQPLLAKYDFVPFTENEIVSSNLFFRCLCLPSGTAMSNLDIIRVSDTLKKIIHKYK